MTPAQRDEFIARIDERTLRVLQSLESIQKDQRAFDDRLSKLSATLSSRVAVLEAENSSHKSVHRWSNARSIAFGVVTTIAGALGVKTLEGTHW